MKKTKKVKKFFTTIKNKIVVFYNKKIKKSRVKFNMLETIIFMLIVFAFGLIIGGIIMYGKGSYATSNTSLNEFVMAYNELRNSYYQEIDDDKLLEAGISGMINYLGDPYSKYFQKDEADDFTDDVEGTYQGIGANIRLDDEKVIFDEVRENYPAAKAGILKDDELLEVDGKSIKGMDLFEIANIVKGEKGTKVELKIKRKDEEKKITITRGVIDTISVNSYALEKNGKRVGYIGVTIFASNTAKQFKEALQKLENEEKIDSLVIDVRGNSGGYLTTVSDIISMFIKKGQPIYQLKVKDVIDTIYDETEEARSYPIAVLADNGSASASELLVAALKEIYGAKFIGTKTYGKGLVQKVATLSSGAIFKYTHQEWLTPKGNYIDKVGITPDINIVFSNYEDGTDNQLQMAFEVMAK